MVARQLGNFSLLDIGMLGPTPPRYFLVLHQPAISFLLVGSLNSQPLKEQQSLVNVSQLCITTHGPPEVTITKKKIYI